MSNKARHFVYELLHTTEIETKLEHYVRTFITTLIIFSIISVMLETMSEVEEQIGTILYIIEVVIVFIFSIEYLLRLWSCVELKQYENPILGRLRYSISFLALIDLIAIAPFYIPHLVKIDLRFIRGLRLIRLLRILKFGRYSTALGLITKVLQRKKDEIAVALSILTFILTMSASLMYYLEHEAQPTTFKSIPATLWWAVATLTTIGYGDVVPVTVLGRICAAIISIIGISFFALPSAILVSGFLEETQTKKPQKMCPHCGKEIT